jgi:mono/diheme cytochrome c family protein
MEKVKHMKNTLNALAAATLAAGMLIASSPAIAADPKPGKSSDRAMKESVERGRYLVAITGCNDCHTPNFSATGKKTAEKDLLTGTGVGHRGSWGTTYAPNLRLYFQTLDEDQWVQVAKEIERKPPMPYFSLNAMSGPDVRAIYRYINSLGAAGAPAPKFLFSSATPPQPYIQYPD